MKTAKIILNSLMGDAFRIIPLLNALVDQDYVKIVWMCGKYHEPAARFLTYFYPIELIVRDDIGEPIDLNYMNAFINTYWDEFQLIDADLTINNPELICSLQENCLHGITPDLTLRNLDLLMPKQERSIVLQPFTRHIWKNNTALYNIDWNQFDCNVYAAGLPGELIPDDTIDYRGKSFFKLAKRIVASNVVVTIHSAVANLAFYLNHPTIIIHPFNHPHFHRFSEVKDNMIDMIEATPTEIINNINKYMEQV